MVSPGSPRVFCLFEVPWRLKNYDSFVSGYLERTGENCSRIGVLGVELKHEKVDRCACLLSSTHFMIRNIVHSQEIFPALPSQ